MVSSSFAMEQIPTKTELLLNCFAAALAGIAEKYTEKRLERRTALQEGEVIHINCSVKSSPEECMQDTEK